MHKIIFFFTVLFLFFSCSSEKDSIVDSGLNKPPVINVPVDTVGQGFTLFAKDHVLDSDSYKEGGFLLNQGNNAKYNKSNRSWQGVPSIGKDRYGNLYSAWFTGGKGEGIENYITLSLSKNKGKSWDNDKLIIYVNPEDSTRVLDPCFFNDKFGNLYLTWVKHVKKKEFKGKEWAVTWYTKLNLSKEGDTIRFSQPRKIAEGIMINKPIYSEFSDQEIFPIARWYENDAELQQPFLYKATFGVNNLINLTKAGGIPLKTSIMGIHEHMIVQLKDNTFLGMVRTLDGIYCSRSKDGNIWDFGQKFTDLGPTTSSRFHLARLKSGRLILIFNNSLSRSNMTICISDNDGITWPYRMILDSDNYVSYPDMIETDQGTLNIVYDYARSPNGTIHFVSVKEEDIIKNIMSNVFRTKISTLK